MEYGALLLTDMEGFEREICKTQLEHYTQVAVQSERNHFPFAWVLAGIGIAVVVFTLLVMLSGV